MQNRNLSPYQSVHLQRRRHLKVGFTLVELLVVLVIIGMLASMVSFAMFRSMQAAREAKTQALIAKLHNVIARQWDTFETGQPPEYISTGTPPAGLTSEEQERWRAQQKVLGWMKDEMPCSQGEFEGSNTFILLFDRNGSDTIAESNDTYTDENGNEIPESPINDDVATQDAQCLYQIVLLLADDDLDRINLFSENETKDLITVDSDGDGTLDAGDGTPDYFIDGWGQPIGFIREPSGFTDSDINDPPPATNPLTGLPTGVFFPLIYSRGPDKTSGLSLTGAASGDEHLDNIHNHRMNARLQ